MKSKQHRQNKMSTKSRQQDVRAPAGPVGRANSTSNVKVLVRVRPRVSREMEQGQPVLVAMKENATTLTNPKPKEQLPGSPSKARAERAAGAGACAGAEPAEDRKTFTFDHSLWSVSSQDAHFVSQQGTYEVIGQEILAHSLRGFNTCIFAYGQTGSGKSYTMMGSAEEPGIIPRTCQELFAELGRFPAHIKAQVKVSYFEIYNEQVNDLLGEGKNLRVRENPQTGPYVEQLSEFVIESYEDFGRYMELGNHKRTVASTRMNEQSSRSHAVFTISLRLTEFSVEEDVVKETHSSLRLIDLAGSERASATGAVSGGLRLKEGSNINKSLTTLGRVISALSDGSGQHKPPFRDSTLTWLLKESLGGNSKTAMIACISPCDYDESLSTLRYATLAKKVQLSAQANVDEIKPSDNSHEMARMKLEIAELTRSLDHMKEQDALVGHISNMSRFFENRLLDKTNQYEFIKLRLMECNAKLLSLEKKYNLVTSAVLSDRLYQRGLLELSVEHSRLAQCSDEGLSDFKTQLEQLAPLAPR